jgi:hypothetical protein
MQKINKFFISFFLLIFLISAKGAALFGQTTYEISTIPTFLNNNGTGGVSFNIHNTNSFDIKITEIEGIVGTTSASCLFEMYLRNDTVNGPTGTINAAGGWNLVATNTFAAVGNTTNNTTLQTFMDNMNVIIPANSSRGVVIFATSQRYYTITTTSESFTTNGVKLQFGTNISYGGSTPPTAGSNNPRGWLGKIHFQVVGSSGYANDAGVTQLISPANFCQGSQMVSARISNFGNNTLTTATVNWSANGVLQTPATLSTPLDTPGGTGINSAIVNLGNYNFTGAPVNLKIWTSAPNSAADPNNGNDTLQTTVQASLSGTYTINSGAPASATNYQSLTAFAADLNTYGVCGPVTANVVAGSGPYVETVSFDDIQGTSAVNRIRINGNGATVQFNPTSTTNHRIVSLNGTKYLTIDNLKIKSLSATYGWGVHITGTAQHDSIINCEVNLSTITGTSSANANGIVVSGSTTSATTATSGVSDIYILNNNVIAGGTGSGGAYYGISVSGTSSSDRAPNIFVDNNEVTNFYYYGINVQYAKTGSISNNNIHRPNKTSVTTCYALRVYYDDSMLVNANKIHDLAATGTTSTSSLYGLYLYYTDNSVISNNVLYNLKNYIGTQYIFYSYYSDFCKIYHNTISTDAVQGTNTGTMYHYYIYYNANTEVKNNLLNATGGNTGTKYGLYVTPTTATYPVTLQKNNIYVGSSQSGTQTPYYYGTAYASLAAFQTAYPTQEVGSISVNPNITNPTTGDLTPTNAALSGYGENLMMDVPFDIIGTVRAPLPTPGAFEIQSATGPNAGLMSLINPSDIFCSGTQGVSVSVMNAGTVPLTNFQIQWQLNGVTQAPYTYTGTLDITTGTGQFLDTVTLGNVNIPAGNNTIKAWVVVPGDVSNMNDTIEVSNIIPSSLTISSFSDTVCASAPINLELAPNGNYSNGTIEWQSSANGTTWNPIANADGTSESFTGFTSNTSFRVKYTKPTGVCYSSVKAITLTNPSIVNTIADTVCTSGVLTLSATANPGSVVKWYDAATGGTELATGGTFTTPNLTATTTYYAGASVANGGTGTVGPLNPTVVGAAGGTAAAITTYHMAFDVLQPTTLISVDVYPTAAVGSTGAIQIRNSADAILTTVSYTTTVTGGNTPQTIMLNLPMVPGTGYKMGQSTAINLQRNTAGAVYPYTSNAINITSNNFGAGYYYYFYNWNFTSGCEGATRVPVTAVVNPGPTVNLGADVAICAGASTTLDATNTAAGASYTWNTNATTPTISVNTPGTYSVTVTANGCSAADTIVVAAAPSPTLVLADTVKICDGSTTTLNAGNSGSTYNWSTGATTQSITTGTNGWHSVTITTADNCEGEDSTYILVNALPTVDLGNDTAVCPNANFILDAGNVGATYLWSTGETTQTIIPTQSGTYTVIVTDANGCEGTDDAEVVQFDAALTDGFTFIPEFNVQPGQVAFEPINPQYVDEYFWDFGDGNTSTLENPTHIYQTSGNYTVTLTVTNECGANDTSMVIAVDLLTGIKKLDGAHLLIDIYPVPAKEALQIATNAQNNKIESISVVNALGQQVKFHTNINQATTSVSVNDLANGNYYLKIKTKQGEAVKKFTILK